MADVLNLLADSPEKDFSLAEITRRTSLSAATAHALLAEMVDQGFLLRASTTKRYVLGPTLIRLGHLADRAGDPLALARAELVQLIDELGLRTTTTHVVGRHILVDAREGDPGPWGMTVNVGQRLPMAPPLGSVFLACSDRPAVEEWLSRVDSTPSRSSLDRCRQALTAIRQVAAPVFDAHGRVSSSIAAMYGGEVRTGRDLRHEAGRIVAAADRVTAAIHGRHPRHVHQTTEESA